MSAICDRESPSSFNLTLIQANKSTFIYGIYLSHRFKSLYDCAGSRCFHSEDGYSKICFLCWTVKQWFINSSAVLNCSLHNLQNVSPVKSMIQREDSCEMKARVLALNVTFHLIIQSLLLLLYSFIYRYILLSFSAHLR